MSDQVVIYCDESRHVYEPDSRYMGIGGLWVPRDLRDRFRDYLDSEVLQGDPRGELKWSKVSDTALPGYRALVDAFFDVQPARFRCIVIDHQRVDHDAYHDGDAELGFYKFYYQMLVKWLHPDTDYTVLLDHKTNSASGRYGKLERVLRTATDPSTTIKLSAADSAESRLAQLCDVLVGAVTSAWCGTPAGTAKHSLQEHIASRLGRSSLRFASPSPREEKVNVFKLQLRQNT